MAQIPEEIVSETWQDVAGGDEDAAAALGQRFADEQPELVEYIFSLGETLSHGAAELGVYLATVVWSMFERSHAHVPRVRRAEIEQVHLKNQSLFEEIDTEVEEIEDEDDFIHQLSLHGTLRQPDVLGYVYDSLMEAEAGNAEFQADAEDVGTLLVVLKSVIDCLDSALGKAPRAEA